MCPWDVVSLTVRLSFWGIGVSVIFLLFLLVEYCLRMDLGGIVEWHSPEFGMYLRHATITTICLTYFEVLGTIRCTLCRFLWYIMAGFILHFTASRA